MTRRPAACPSSPSHLRLKASSEGELVSQTVCPSPDKDPQETYCLEFLPLMTFIHSQMPPIPHSPLPLLLLHEELTPAEMYLEFGVKDITLPGNAVTDHSVMCLILWSRMMIGRRDHSSWIGYQREQQADQLQ
jgi:hypothetical protein